MANLTMTNWHIEDNTPYISLGSAGENNAKIINIEVDEIIDNANYYLDIGDENGIELPNTQQLATKTLSTINGDVIHILCLKPLVSFLGKEGIKLLQVRCVYTDNNEEVVKESNVFHAKVDRNSGFIYKYNIAIFEEYLNKIKKIVSKISDTLNLHSLSDVDIKSPINNQVLKYNSDTHKWENKDNVYENYVTQEELTETLEVYPTKSETNNIVYDVITDELGIINLIPYPYYDGKYKTDNGLIYNVQNNGSIIINGTSTGFSNYKIAQKENLFPHGVYTFFANSDNFTSSNIQIIIGITNKTTYVFTPKATINKNNSKVSFTIDDNWDNYYTEIRIAIANNTIIDNLIVYPMIYHGTKENVSWSQFAMPNDELTQLSNNIVYNLHFLNWESTYLNNNAVNNNISVTNNNMNIIFKFPTLSFSTLTWVYGCAVCNITNIINDINTLDINIDNINFNGDSSYKIDSVYISSNKNSWGGAIQLTNSLNQHGDTLIDFKTVYQSNKDTIDNWDNIYIMINFTHYINTTEFKASDISIMLKYYPYEINTNRSIICWGDSLTANGGWTTTLADLSGLAVYNGGTGGENAQTIMARQGGDIMITNNIIIPSTTTPVVIASKNEDSGISTELNNKVTPLLQGGSNHVNPVLIGNTLGTLTWTGSDYADPNGTWTFTRSIAGDAITIDRPTAIRTMYDRIYNNKNDIMIIFMGQNGWGSNDVNDLIHMHKLMIDHFEGKEYVILGLSSGTSANRSDYESAMVEAFGRRFISLRQYLAHPIYDGNNNIISCYGLADQNLTPTSDDIDKIAIGQVPSQCFVDGVHFTNGTKTVIGDMLYKKMCELNIL